MLKLQTQGQASIFSFELGGKQISCEIGELAMQAGGAVLVRCEETAVLVTATSSTKPREGIDFFPLLVDYAATSGGRAACPRAPRSSPG